jgi:transcriptional regulator
VYLPKHNLADADTLRQMLAELRAADLISSTQDGPYVTFLPLIYEESIGEHGALLGHVARKNDHWRLNTIGESMVLIHGPESYVSPSWYASKREHGKVVPTWNYLTVHIYGELKIHDDTVWLESFVRRLTGQYESPREHPWQVDDAPRPYLDGQLKAIVGVELEITRIEAKAKYGQQRSAEDINGTIEGLRGDGELELADLTEAAAAKLQHER